ncbi:MAG: SpoIID/LytB domain-containing protein [Gemmatimonadota bacterium]
MPAPAARPPVAVRPPWPGAREARPVRVRLDGPGARVVLEGETIRVWTPDGTLLAEGGGSVVLAARGDRIAWGSAREIPSPADFGAPGGIRADGKRFPGRVRVTASQGRLQVVAVVPLEEYVAAVISREAPRTFAREALQALAVAARTYALAAMARPRDPAFDVVGGVDDQLFEGTDGSGGPFRAAAEATRGMVLYYGGSPAQAVYHSTCGGSTESAADAWGRDVPYLRAVACDDCRDSPAWRWEYRMTRDEGRRVALALGVRAGGDLSIAIVGATPTGRASRVRLASAGVSRETAAASFRRAAGYARVKSLKMRIASSPGGWTFHGDGYGHGVGMCQWGANGMAKRGKGFREILARYYPGTHVAGAGR